MSETHSKISWEWQSVGEMLAQLDRKDYRTRTSRDAGGSWAGTESWEECVRFATQGWPEGEQRVRAISDALEAAILPGIVREQWNYDVEGMAFDVARYIEGEPECWVRIDEEESKESPRHVSIAINVAVSGGVSREVIMARGAAIAALVNMLEFSGKRCEVWCVGGWNASGYSRTHRENPDATFKVKIKAYDQPLEPGRTAFFLVNPSVQRRIVFAAFEQRAADLWGVLQPPSYGMPASFPATSFGLYFGESMLGDYQLTDPARAAEWVKAKLKEQGVVVR